MGRRIVNIFAAIASAALAAAVVLIASMSSFAAENVSSGSASSTANVTSGSATSTTAVFNKYLVMDADTYVPAYTGTFTITPGPAASLTSGSSVSGTSSGMLPVLAGTGSPTVSAAVFSTSDTTTSGTPANPEDTAHKYITKEIVVDFSGVTFREPGVYRYIIAEDDPDCNGIINDTESSRTLDVYVTTGESYTGSGVWVNSIAGYVMYSGTRTDAAVNASPDAGSGTPSGTSAPSGTATASTEVSGKSNSFTNTVSSQDISIGKEVTGNHGSRDKYFKFTVTITGLPAGQKMDVELVSADAKVRENDATKSGYAGMANSTELTAGGDGKAEAAYYLADGDYISIKGVLKGASYTVTEDAENYTSSEGITAAAAGAAKAASEDAADGVVGISDIRTGFTNDRSGAVPTGVAAPAGGGAIALAAGVGGLIMTMFAKKRRREEE